MHDPDVGHWEYVYDENGNLVQQSGGGGNLVTGDEYYREYDGSGQLTRVRNGSTSTSPVLENYTYDHAGQRVKIWRNDSANTTIYTPFPEMMRIVNSSGTYDYYYVYHEGQLVARKNPDGTTAQIHTDHLGSSTVSTNATQGIIEQTTYDPYGLELSGGNYDVKRYTGQFDDELTQQMYYGARYYVPGRGMFVQPDQVISNIYNPQNWNRYAYVLNNPYKFVDPDGKEVREIGRQVQFGLLGFFGNHYYLQITPDVPSDFSEEYSSTFTVGAYDIDNKLQIRVNAEPAEKDQNVRYNQIVLTPGGMTDTQFIRNILETSKVYQSSNNLENYDFLSRQNKGYNSNSAATALLVASGANPKNVKADALFYDPGINKPSPKIIKSSPLSQVVSKIFKKLRSIIPKKKGDKNR